LSEAIIAFLQANFGILGMMPRHSPFFKDEFEWGIAKIHIKPVDKDGMTTLENIMTHDVTCIDLDVTIGEAIELCSQCGIRHLPILDEDKRLAGMVSDRDLRHSISPRLGTISENNSDRETLNHHVHRIMVREVVSASPETTLAEAAQLMLTGRIGCLPVVDNGGFVIGIVTTTDLLRHLSESKQ
jgi:acetoin utilization protein AcuB